MEWTSSGVRIWYFARNNIPTSITSEASPDVDTWAVPAASFEGSCDFDAHLFDHSLVSVGVQHVVAECISRNYIPDKQR